MDRGETTTLHREGREKWNAWAKDRLAKKVELEASAASLTEWGKTAEADFRSRNFDRNMHFDGYIFPGTCHFNDSTFSHFANFDRAIFHDDVTFDRVTFKDLARFRSACFHRAANFAAIQAESSFDLSNTRFRTTVPNFIQAHFPEAPRFDHVHVPTVRQLRRVGTKIEPYTTARYRALKRLAIQGHDHERELQFFADELRSQRSSRWNVRSLLIEFYGFFSDFGRSIFRPALWWLVTTVGFAASYLGRHALMDSSGCIAGSGSPFRSAIYVALRKALIFPGLGTDQKLDVAYACLFGKTQISENGRALPLIPDSIAYLGIAQTLISAALIFLILLAVRNQFRIK